MSDVKIDLELITKQFDRSLSRSIAATDRFAKTLDKNFKNTQKSLNETARTTSRLEKSLVSTFSKGSQAFGSFIGNVGANLVTGAFSKLTDAAFSFGSAVVKNAVELETLSTQFTTLTGSADQASQVIQDLQQFSARTPFQLEGLATTSRQLLSFGFGADELIPKLQSIGDVAAATGSNVQDIGLIFGQISAAGKLTGERLLQLQERGVPVLDALAKQFGVTQAEAREMVTQGKVDFKAFEQAFNSLSQEGGIAFEGMIKRSQTLEGVISTLGDNFKVFAGDIGTALLPTIKAIAIEFTKFIQSIDTKQIKNFITEGIASLLTGLQDITKFINPVINSFRFLGNTGVFVFDLLRNGVNTIQAAFAGLTSSLANNISSLINSLPDSIVPTSWKENLNAFKEVSNETFEEFSAKLGETTAASIESFNSIGDSFTNVVSEENIELVKEKLESVKQSVITSNQETNNAIINSNKNRSDENKKLLDKEQKDQDSFFTSMRKGFDQNLQYEKLTNQQRAQNFKSTLGTISSLAQSSNKTLSGIGKAAAITTATIDGYVAVQKALASAPPPINFALAAAVGTATAANVAKIAGVKGFEQGGIVPGSSFTGDKVQAAVNSGEMILNKAQQSQLFNQANGGGSTGSQDMQQIVDAIRSMSITLVADDVEIARSVSRGVSNGIVIGQSV